MGNHIIPLDPSGLVSLLPPAVPSLDVANLILVSLSHQRVYFVILKCTYLFKKMRNLKALEYSQHEYEGTFPRVPKRVLHPQGFWRACPVLHLLRWRGPFSLAHSPTSRPVFGQSQHRIGGTMVGVLTIFFLIGYTHFVWQTPLRRVKHPPPGSPNPQ